MTDPVIQPLYIRLLAAVRGVIYDIRADHFCWDEKCPTCQTRWPCTYAIIARQLERAI
jgi:hypothetical protein